MSDNTDEKIRVIHALLMEDKVTEAKKVDKEITKRMLSMWKLEPDSEPKG